MTDDLGWGYLEKADACGYVDKLLLYLPTVNKYTRDSTIPMTFLIIEEI